MLLHITQSCKIQLPKRVSRLRRRRLQLQPQFIAAVASAAIPACEQKQPRKWRAGEQGSALHRLAAFADPCPRPAVKRKHGVEARLTVPGQPMFSSRELARMGSLGKRVWSDSESHSSLSRPVPCAWSLPLAVSRRVWLGPQLGTYPPHSRPSPSCAHVLLLILNTYRCNRSLTMERRIPGPGWGSLCETLSRREPFCVWHGRKRAQSTDSPSSERFLSLTT